MTTPAKSAFNSLAAKQIKSEGNLSQIGAIKLQAGRAVSAYVGFINAVQTLERMEKAGFIPNAWVIKLTEQVQPP